TSEMELITRRVITKLEGKEADDEMLRAYADPDSDKYQNMIDEICKELKFTSLRYHRLDDMLASVGIDEDKLCTYCWDGRE
ncbi:MAG: amidophosphoribosyltransferase, partial [Eubacterium sp.]|nr:amidophosphoribosyltransferase [Eubacterium sp.]